MGQILIIMASETENMALAEMLNQNHDITLFSNPVAAAPHLQQDFDGLLLELFLPGMDGLSFLEENRSKCPPTIILLTKLLCPDILTRAENAGVDVLVRKPCQTAVIVNLLEQLLAEKNPSRVTGRGMKSQEDTPV